ncbi:hypothetical protein AB6A40_006693 [Gnathostoma spinigerum]|uniref:Uncharacterized protein n=1 Tax=Gnathostoma spinigerum TaxID=75299 RepID=A0ABD6ERS2_9BILA
MEFSGFGGPIYGHSRNPYSWMNEMKRKYHARNPYAWTNFEKRAGGNPFFWLGDLRRVNENVLGGEPEESPFDAFDGKMKRLRFWTEDGKRAPRNPYSWQYTLRKRGFPFSVDRSYVANPYSWLNYDSQ